MFCSTVDTSGKLRGVQIGENRCQRDAQHAHLQLCRSARDGLEAGEAALKSKGSEAVADKLPRDCGKHSPARYTPLQTSCPGNTHAAWHAQDHAVLCLSLDKPLRHQMNLLSGLIRVRMPKNRSCPSDCSDHAAGAKKLRKLENAEEQCCSPKGRTCIGRAGQCPPHWRLLRSAPASSGCPVGTS